MESLLQRIKPALATLGLLVVFGLCAFLLSNISSAPGIATTPTTGAHTQPPTPETMAYLAASKGFQYLISYTGRGFEPATLTIKKGETIRFTNNSAGGLWVAATGTSGKIYPSGTGNECGQSAFDSCKVMKSGEFWEFTFTTVGTWGYKNNADTKMTGTVTVK
jgi:plastocyanin